MDGLVSHPHRTPEEHRAYNKAWRESNPTTRENWSQRNIPFVRFRAKRKSLPFTIKASDVLVPTHCPVLGIPFVFGATRNNPASPSFDRIKPELGYVPGNVAVISLRANMIKHNATAEELFCVSAWLEAQTC